MEKRREIEKGSAAFLKTDGWAIKVKCTEVTDQTRPCEECVLYKRPVFCREMLCEAAERSDRTNILFKDTAEAPKEVVCL